MKVDCEKIKKIIALLTTILCLALVSGCGSKEEPTNNTANNFKPI